MLRRPNPLPEGEGALEIPSQRSGRERIKCWEICSGSFSAVELNWMSGLTKSGGNGTTGGWLPRKRGTHSTSPLLSQAGAGEGVDGGADRLPPTRLPARSWRGRRLVITSAVMTRVVLVAVGMAGLALEGSDSNRERGAPNGTPLSFLRRAVGLYPVMRSRYGLVIRLQELASRS